MDHFRDEDQAPSRHVVLYDSRGNRLERPGKAGPELLPADMRRLPGELVTKEVHEDKKIHALDDPHIKVALADDYRKAQSAAPEVEDYEAEANIPRGEAARLTQERVDIVRLRVMRALAGNGQEPGQKLRVFYLWFPADDINRYELRQGNPPSDRDRPRHMHRLRLEIDLASGRLPETVVDKMNPAQRIKYKKHIERVRTGYYFRKKQLIIEPEGFRWIQ